VAAPSSSIDLNLVSGDRIPIERRSGDEVKKMFGKSIAPKKTPALHPAFDVTPARYVGAIITEMGVIRKPFDKNIRRIISKLRNTSRFS